MIGLGLSAGAAYVIATIIGALGSAATGAVAAPAAWPRVLRTRQMEDIGPSRGTSESGDVMVSIHVGVEIDEAGLAMAWVQEYLGCTSHGKSQEEAVQLLPDALRVFWSWLRAHGEPDVPEDAEDIEIQEIEVCHVQSQLVDGDSEGSFAFDRHPLTPAELQRALRYMSYARSDVVALAHDLDRQALQQVVGRSGRSIGATLNHLAFTDLWYAQRADVIGDGSWEAYLLDRLRDMAVEWVQRAFEDGHQAAESIVGPNAWGNDGRPESWTLAKTLRRYVWHDLLHTRAMRRALPEVTER